MNFDLFTSSVLKRCKYCERGKFACRLSSAIWISRPVLKYKSRSGGKITLKAKCIQNNIFLRLFYEDSERKMESCQKLCIIGTPCTKHVYKFFCCCIKWWFSQLRIEIENRKGANFTNFFPFEDAEVTQLSSVLAVAKKLVTRETNDGIIPLVKA